MPLVFKPFQVIEKFPSLVYGARITLVFKPDHNSTKQENTRITNIDTKTRNKILANLSFSILKEQ